MTYPLTQLNQPTSAGPGNHFPAFPAGLLEWAGHRSGGVRMLFDDGSGRPSGRLIETALLHRLRNWARSVAGGELGTPRILLLIGGPGNGKTEAIEETIRALEDSLGIRGRLQDWLRPRFSPIDGTTVPRLVRIALDSRLGCSSDLTLTLVQDASVADPQLPGRTAAALLVDDLTGAIEAGTGHLYLACVNRGVLDDALIFATDRKIIKPRELLEAVVRAVGMSPAAPPCWPLANRPDVAIWPMDVESLLVQRPPIIEDPSPAAQILAMAVDSQRWPELGACPAGDRCPFCLNRELMSGERQSTALLQLLRRYELATGKRWSFRDLFSLMSFMLAGSPSQDAARDGGPCEWAARLIELNARGSGKPDSLRLAAPFILMAAQYQHVLFGSWPRFGRAGIRSELRELKLDDDPDLLGLHHFLVGGRGASLPETLRAQLAGICDVLDPALADPDLDVDVSKRSQVRLRELDARFSHGVREGLQFIRKYHALSPLEVDVLARLADADERVGASDVRRRKPTVAARLQVILRDFACRVVRRSIGTRVGVVRDLAMLRDFELVVAGDDQLMHQAVKQVEGLLNERERFIVTLNTTFGEPLPPETRRVVLETAKQKVRPQPLGGSARPSADLRFLAVGAHSAKQWIPLTYELFRSVRELQNGMLAASLPRTVIAALDTARARLAGRIVRDEEQLDGSEIRIGIRDQVIVREMARFLVRTGGES